MGEATLFLVAVFLSALLLFSMIFFIIMFSDLECDFINPIDLCQKLNRFLIWEYLGQAAITAMFLLSLSWKALFLNVPLTAYNMYKLFNNRHTYDATEIFRTLPVHKRECFIKLAFYMCCFFYYLYRMILGLIAG